MVDYISNLRLAKWGSGVSLHGSNPEPLMSALPPKADIALITNGLTSGSVRNARSCQNYPSASRDR